MEDTQQHDAGGVIEITRQSSSMGLIIRQKEPDNLESPFLPVDSFLTPTELFYIRSHFAAPKLDLVSYQLHIDGAVRNPLSLSYRQLRDMPPETRVAILECAGNSRVFLAPQVEGAQWELGAVGNAELTGVPLNQSQAGIRRVIAVGSCCGEQVARSWDGRHAGCTETMEVGPECDPVAGVSRPDAARAGALARAVAAG